MIKITLFLQYMYMYMSDELFVMNRVPDISTPNPALRHIIQGQKSMPCHGSHVPYMAHGSHVPCWFLKNVPCAIYG